ncbi:MAG: ATP-binding protein, partial [Lawsonibacter sp.]
MLARRLPSILPDMSRSEALEATEIHSVMGLTDPDHPSSAAAPSVPPPHHLP